MFPVTNFFGLTPNYNVKLEKVVNSKQRQSLIIFLTAFLVFVASYSTYRRFDYAVSFLDTIEAVILAINELIAIALFLLVTLRSLRTKTRHYESFIKNLQEFDELFITKPSTLIKTKRVLFKLLLLNGILFVFFFEVTFVHYHLLGQNGFVFFLTTEFFMVFEINLSFVLATFVAEIGLRFKQIEQALRKDLSLVKVLRFGHFNLFLCVQLFNNVYGFVCLFIIVRSALIMLSTINYMMICVALKLPTKVEILLMCSGIAILGLINSIWISFSCDQTNKQALEVTQTCYELREEMPQELNTFLGQTNSLTVSFEAAGFFTINRGVLIGLLGTTATYLIILLQLINQEELVVVPTKNSFFYTN